MSFDRPRTSAHFRTNLVEIFIRGSTDLINFWSHFIELPSYPDLWPAIHFPCILDKLLESWVIPQIWLRFGHASLNFHLPLIVWALTAHFRTNCSWVFVKIFIRVVRIFDYLLVMLHCSFSASWPLINLVLYVYFWTNCSTGVPFHIPYHLYSTHFWFLSV